MGVIECRPQHLAARQILEETAQLLGQLLFVDGCSAFLADLGLAKLFTFDADHGGQDFLDHVAVRGDLFRDRRRDGRLPLQVRAGDKRAGEAGEKQTNEGVGPT